MSNFLSKVPIPSFAVQRLQGGEVENESSNSPVLEISGDKVEGLEIAPPIIAQPQKRLLSSDDSKQPQQQQQQQQQQQKQVMSISVPSQEIENSERKESPSPCRRSPREPPRTSYVNFVSKANGRPANKSVNDINVEGCPTQLIVLLCADAKKRYKACSYMFIQNKIQKLWDETHDDIKQTLPDSSSSNENYEDQIKEWKIEHFGNKTFSNQPFSSKRVTRGPAKKKIISQPTGDRALRSNSKVHSTTNTVLRQSKRVLDARKTNEEVPVIIQEQEGQASRPKRSRKQSVKMQHDTGNPVAPPKRRDSLRQKQSKKRQSASSSRDEEKKEEDVATQKRPKVENGPPAQPAPFELPNDPNEYYVEEEAFLYHNPPIPSEFTEGVKPEDLKAIPPPMPLPELPRTGKCTWTFDEAQRILLADFSASASSFQGGEHFAMDPKDEAFFLEMLERDDITVISEGLLSQSTLNPEYWKLEYLQTVLNQEYYHKFRRFDTTVDTNGLEKCREVDGMYSMRIGTYVEYLKKRHNVLTSEEGASTDPSFSFVDHEGREQKIGHVGVSAIYMIDLDINKLVPNLHEDFLDSFRYPGVLPGGDHCMMNSVRCQNRSFHMSLGHFFFKKHISFMLVYDGLR